MANEKRLIDANAFKMALCTKEGAEALGHSTVKLARVSAIVDAQPTIDTVEVVRCKDCKYYELATIFDGSQKMRCENKKGIWTATPSDAFCSYGERREGE